MEDLDFLTSVAEGIQKALHTGGYTDVKFFDEELVVMDGPTGKDAEENPKAARSFEPVSEHDIIISTAYMDKERYELLVILDNDVDFMKFDKTVGTQLKQLAGIWGSRLEYKIQTLGKEIKSKDGLKQRIRGNKDNEEYTMSSHLSEKASMTGTTRSSYQKIGECKVIIRHSGKVNEEKFGSRSRNIDAIFIETKSGERFKMAENNLHGARAMARHLSNGGSPFDSVGSKVTVMMNEMAQLRKMALEARVIRKTQVLSEEQDELINQIKTRFIGLRETLKKMSGKVGYMKHSPMLEGEESLLELETDPKRQWGGATRSPEDTVDMDSITLVTHYLDKMADHMSNIAGDRGELRREAFAAVVPDENKREFLDAMSNQMDRIENTPSYKAVYGGEDDDAPQHSALANISRAAYAGPTPGSLPINEKASTKVETETKAAKKKEEKDTVRADQVPVYDREPIGDFSRLVRDADDLFSVNENKYGVAPEEVILESWFDEAATVEFFNEEELVIEDAAPEVKKTLPENALGMLNLYVGHPLFNHYMKMYEEQEILDDVLALVEEGSKLCENITTVRETISAGPSYGLETMTIGRGEHPSDKGAELANFDEALTKINALISDRRLNIERAIDQVAKEIIGEDQDPDSYEQVVNHLWGLAEESGLVKHDFGSTFSDQVLAPNETISAHNDEIDTEEFYGDARFAESNDSAEDDEKLDENELDELNQVRKNAGLELMVREMSEKCACGCDKGSCDCGPECDCGCNAMNEGDPFARQSKRHLANPKERMSLINPADKMTSAKLGEEEDVDEGKVPADWVGNRQRSMDNRLDKVYGKRDRTTQNKPTVRKRDQYDDMADRAGINSKTGMRDKKPRYEEVEMPHHLPAADKPKGTPELSEDGARIIELARYKQ